jgi:hypothetical protein
MELGCESSGEAKGAKGLCEGTVHFIDNGRIENHKELIFV